jgi:hypothetical protein
MKSGRHHHNWLSQRQGIVRAVHSTEVRRIEQHVRMMQQTEVPRRIEPGHEINATGHIFVVSLQAISQPLDLRVSLVTGQDRDAERITSQHGGDHLVEIDVELAELLCTNIPMAINRQSKCLAGIYRIRQLRACAIRQQRIG